MFQINWKLKAFLYKVFQFLKLKKTFYFIQKYITKRSRININEYCSKNFNRKLLINNLYYISIYKCQDLRKIKLVN